MSYSINLLPYSRQALLDDNYNWNFSHDNIFLSNQPAVIYKRPLTKEQRMIRRVDGGRLMQALSVEMLSQTSELHQGALARSIKPRLETV